MQKLLGVKLEIITISRELEGDDLTRVHSDYTMSFDYYANVFVHPMPPADWETRKRMTIWSDEKGIVEVRLSR